MYNWNLAKVEIGPIEMDLVYNMRPHEFTQILSDWVIHAKGSYSTKAFCQYVADRARIAPPALPWEDDVKDWIVIPRKDFEALFKKYGYSIHESYFISISQEKPSL